MRAEDDDPHGEERALARVSNHEMKDLCVCGSRSAGQEPADCAQTLRVFACFVSLSFAGLVVLARSLNPIPSRTRPLNSSAPMVLWLKPWESRSLPGLPRTKQFLFTCHDRTKRRFRKEAAFFCLACCMRGHMPTAPRHRLDR